MNQSANATHSRVHAFDPNQLARCGYIRGLGEVVLQDFVAGHRMTQAPSHFPMKDCAMSFIGEVALPSEDGHY
jgi:hypothetical protein